MTIKLTDIYDERDLWDEDEAISIHVDDASLKLSYEKRVIPHADLASLVSMDGTSTVISVYEDHGDEDQKELVAWKVKEFEEDRVIVIMGNVVIDGNHHLVAAHLSGRDVTAIDLNEPVNEPEMDGP